MHRALYQALAFTDLTGRNPPLRGRELSLWKDLTEDGEVRPEAEHLVMRNRMWKAANWLIVWRGFRVLPDASTTQCIVLRRRGRIALATSAGEARCDGEVVARFRNGAEGGRPVGLPGRLTSLADGDLHNCAPASISWATGESYRRARAACKAAGWAPERRGMPLWGVHAALRRLGWAAKEHLASELIGWHLAPTLGALERALRGDERRWIVITRGHCLAVRPGGVFLDVGHTGSRTMVELTLEVDLLTAR